MPGKVIIHTDCLYDCYSGYYIVIDQYLQWKEGPVLTPRQSFLPSLTPLLQTEHYQADTQGVGDGTVGGVVVVEQVASGFEQQIFV